MIPAGVDVPDLAQQIDEDSVAYGGDGGEGFARDVEPGLLDAAAHAESGDFGSVGFVVLDRTPERTADLRDIAQDVLLATDVDTVVVRAPGSGAIVSDVHSRSAIESAQYSFLGDPDVVGAAHRFIDDVTGAGITWPIVAVALLLTIAAVVALTAWGVRSVSHR